MITRKINEDEKREILSFSYVNEKKIIYKIYK